MLPPQESKPRSIPSTEPARLLSQHNSPVQQEDLGGTPSKDELQGSLDVPSSGLQGPQAQLIVVDSHVSQLLQLGLPLALLTAKRSLGWVGESQQGNFPLLTLPAQTVPVQTAPESSVMLQSPQIHHPSSTQYFCWVCDHA